MCILAAFFQLASSRHAFVRANLGHLQEPCRKTNDHNDKLRSLWYIAHYYAAEKDVLVQEVTFKPNHSYTRRSVAVCIQSMMQRCMNHFHSSFCRKMSARLFIFGLQHFRRGGKAGEAISILCEIFNSKLGHLATQNGWPWCTLNCGQPHAKMLFLMQFRTFKVTQTYSDSLDDFRWNI